MSELPKVETLRIASSPSELQHVDSVTEDIARRMGFDENALADLGICVTEAVNNAIFHAHKGRSDLPVDIRFEEFRDTLRVYVRDYGNGFDAGHLQDPTRPENLMKATGRGVHLIRALMDEVEIRSLDIGMEVVMTKRRK